MGPEEDRAPSHLQAAPLEDGLAATLRFCLPFHLSFSIISSFPAIAALAGAQTSCTLQPSSSSPPGQLAPAPTSAPTPHILCPSASEQTNDANMSDSSLSDCDDVAADIGVRRAVSTTRHIGLTGFWKLPHELQSRILETACGPPVLPRRVTVGHRSDCTTTMLRLALSCKAFNRQMLPILYANVRLPLPSNLSNFQRTLASRPALGRLVTRLHIGPDEEFRMSEWWPMSHTRLRSNTDTFPVRLTESCDDPRLPRWASPSHSLVPLDSSSSDLSKDVHNAFEAASRDLDVELQSPGSSRSGENIGMDAWRVRVWELQAAMELWCLYTRVCDEEEEQRTAVKPAYGTRPQYPSLAVGGRASSSSAAGGEVFHVTRAALYQRMSRKEALTNHFGHPLLSARSGLRWRVRGLGQTWHDGGRRRHAVQEGEDVADLFAWASTPPAPDEDDFDFDADVVVPPSDLCDPLDEDIPATATVGGNLALARTVLSLTPSVSSLSLTGFLERALVGSRPPCHQALRSVNLGPTAAGLSVPAHFEHTALHGVRRLRICGAPLDPPELDAIAGKGGALPKLRQVEWTPTTEWWDIWSDE